MAQTEEQKYAMYLREAWVELVRNPEKYNEGKGKIVKDLFKMPLTEGLYEYWCFTARREMTKAFNAEKQGRNCPEEDWFCIPHEDWVRIMKQVPEEEAIEMAHCLPDMSDEKQEMWRMMPKLL
jgi:hypothetical protein